jgi:hypothetical protein
LILVSAYRATALPPDVFVPNGEARIHPSARLRRRSPELSAGATYERFDGVANESAPMVNTVRAKNNRSSSWRTRFAETASFRATSARWRAVEQSLLHGSPCDCSGEPAVIDSSSWPAQRALDHTAPTAPVSEF